MSEPSFHVYFPVNSRCRLQSPMIIEYLCLSLPTIFTGLIAICFMKWTTTIYTGYAGSEGPNSRVILAFFVL